MLLKHPTLKNVTLFSTFCNRNLNLLFFLLKIKVFLYLRLALHKSVILKGVWFHDLVWLTSDY